MKPFSTIVIILSPEVGAFNSSFSLANAYRERGHRVVYFGLSTFRENVLLEGFEYISVRAMSDEKGSEKGLLARLRRRQFGNRHLFEWHRNIRADLRAWLEQNKPAIALIDPHLWRYVPPLLELMVPIIALRATFASTFSTRYAPVFSGAVPCERWQWNRAMNLCSWLRVLLRGQFRLWSEDIRLLTSFGANKCYDYRAKSLIEKRGGRLVFGEYGARLEAPDLIMSPGEVDFPQLVDLPNRAYAGACVFSKRKAEPFDWEGVSKQKPIIYCSLGTYSHSFPHSKRLFQTVFNALKSRNDLQCILQIGTVGNPEEFENCPNHIRIVRSAPQVEILRHADIFITHGGANSMREAIYCGVPMIVFPCRVDQHGNAARVVYHSLGVRGDISRVTESRLANLMVSVQSSEIRSAMKAMQGVFMQQEDCQAGLAWIDRHLATR